MRPARPLRGPPGLAAAGAVTLWALVACGQPTAPAPTPAPTPTSAASAAPRAPASAGPRAPASTAASGVASAPPGAPASAPDPRPPGIDPAFPFQYQAEKVEGGGAFSLRSLEGQPLMVHVWASWCVPCLEEMPTVAVLHGQYAEAGLRLVTVSIDETRAALQRHLDEEDVPGILLHDPANEARLTFGVDSVPATFVYDRRGRLIFATERPMKLRDQALHDVLRAAVRKAPPARPGP